LQQFEHSPQDLPCGQLALSIAPSGSGAERGGLVRGTENMNPRLSLNIIPTKRRACGNSPRPEDQWRQNRQSPKKYQVIKGAVKNPPTSVTTENTM
jgi:hypothetical protein